MNQRVFEYLWLDTNLRKALDNDQLLIHYQPKIIWRGEVKSLEAYHFHLSAFDIESFPFSFAPIFCII